MKKVFGADQKRINHALTVLDYAEKLQIVEGGDPLVVKAAAILHDIGIHAAETKHGSSSGKYQEIEGPPIARAILQNYDLSDETTDHICKIIANHHSAKDIDTIEFKIIWDADSLVNIPEDFAGAGEEKLRQIIDKTFKTCKGRQIAVESFIKTKTD
jgi:HD superfamily phosphodiesterase